MEFTITERANFAKKVDLDKIILTVADPHYIDDRVGLHLVLEDLTINKIYNDKDFDVTINVSEMEYEAGFGSYNIGVSITQGEPFKVTNNGETYNILAAPVLNREDIELGCDTAEFYIESNINGYGRFNTGADGYYGGAFVFKDKTNKDKVIGLHLDISLDNSLFDLDDVIASFKNLFFGI